MTILDLINLLEYNRHTPGTCKSGYAFFADFLPLSLRLLRNPVHVCVGEWGQD
jgi:hypothetical protein